MSGYALNRNSSRVLNPPGGASSDIFGTGGGPHTSIVSNASRTSAPNGGVPWATEAAPAARSETVGQAQAKRNESTVFRSPIVHKTTSDSAAAAAYRRGRSQVFDASSPRAANGCPWATDEPDQRRQAPVADRPAYRAEEPQQAPCEAPSYSRGYAPVSSSSGSYSQSVNPGSRGANTGDVLMSGHSGRNSSRVTQPPGGASSISFF